MWNMFLLMFCFKMVSPFECEFRLVATNTESYYDKITPNGRKSCHGLGRICVVLHSSASGTQRVGRLRSRIIVLSAQHYYYICIYSTALRPNAKLNSAKLSTCCVYFWNTTRHSLADSCFRIDFRMSSLYQRRWHYQEKRFIDNL